jgi:alpha-L-fucosidase
MKTRHLLFLCVLLPGLLPARTGSASRPFEPTLESLEKANPAPEWFKDAKFGIYFHWGVYSVPAFANEWYPRTLYIAGSLENRHHIETYGDPSVWPYNFFITGAPDKQGRWTQFAPKLKSKGGQFDPDEWAQLFADAGARFAGPVAEHHDGFSMWASRVNPWNAKDLGPKLDLVGLLTDAIRKRNLKVILSMHHAYNITGYYSAVPPTDDPKLRKLFGQQGLEKNEAYWLEKHREIIAAYRPDIIWQDFNLHVLSRPVLLQFLTDYYNAAAGWGREVVATYKDGLNDRCAVLDYERGGPVDITDNYWLTDDAVSSTSWCYTEGLAYYSRKQILHGFLDRISKNGNLLLNISPRADGSIPQEQKDILLSMGDWLKKYGEAVYATRAWVQYGEGPTTMGAGHGVFTAPAEGTSADVRYTRSKDNSTLYAILLGWDDGQEKITLRSLPLGRIDCRSLKSVELINGGAGRYRPLPFSQDSTGLTVRLPARPFVEPAYALKLKFDGPIPKLDRYADLDCGPHYRLAPAGRRGGAVLGADLRLTRDRKSESSQWKMESAGRGVYRIRSRGNGGAALGCDAGGLAPVVSADEGGESRLWKIENGNGGLIRISSSRFPGRLLVAAADSAGGGAAVLTDAAKGPGSGWILTEVCETPQTAFAPHSIPGTVEAEDFDGGCPGDAYSDRDEVNEGGQYRLREGVDVERCSAGGYNVGWTRAGEWMAYSVTVERTAEYKVTFAVASGYEGAKMHLECNGRDVTGILTVPFTGAYQSWTTIEKNVKLDAGPSELRLVIDADNVNLDKMIFEEIHPQ